MNPTLHLTLGISGSGKSSWTNVKSYFPDITISADRLRIKLTDDINDKSKDDSIYFIAEIIIKKHLTMGKNVFFDTTNLRKERRVDLIKELRKEIPNLNVEYHIFPCDVDKSLQNINKDISNNKLRASVSRESLERQAKLYNTMLLDIIEEKELNLVDTINYIDNLDILLVKKTNGYISYSDRNRCEDCIFMKWVGSGSKSQQMTYCTKIEPNFMVTLEDVCDEFEKM